MSRTELLRRLQSQEPVSSEACFVLLWTYLNQGRVMAGRESLALARPPSFLLFSLEPEMNKAGKRQV